MRLFSLSLCVLLSLACGDKEGGDGADGADGADGTDGSDGTDGTDGTDGGGPVDADGDGFTDDVDCDDGNAAINPDATELCDGVDNDCDGDTDEDDAADVTTFYADADADGFGDATMPVEACSAPEGAVDNALDCNDGDDQIFPEADEYCDDVDNDCDGDIDEDDAVDAPLWFADNDIDGFGDPDDGVTACAQPEGRVADNNDCDDEANDVNPTAVEVCNGIDDDCDLAIDDDDDSLDWATRSTWYADGDTDGFGDASMALDACAAPSGYVADNTDCDDAESSTNPGATDIPQDGVDNDCDGEDAPYSLTDIGIGDLIITEVMQNPSAVLDAAGEWFEIYNDSGGEVELSGLYVADASTDSFTVSGSLRVAAGGHVVFGKRVDQTTNGGVPVDYAFGTSMNLGNGDDALILAESAAMAVIFDTVIWDDGDTFPDPNGASMNLDSGAYDAVLNDDGNSWCLGTTTFGSGDRGTPGSLNVVCIAL